MSTRYGLGSKGVLTYDVESTAYTEASSPTTELGITNEEIEPSNTNPHTAMPTGGGGRQPYVQSPDPKDHEFDIPAVLHTPDAPIETAMGSRTQSTVDIGSTGTDDYTKYLFEEADRLPTMTVRHVQADLDLVAYYVGCKSDLTLEWSLGDPLQMTLSVVAARHKFDPAESAPSFSPTLPTDVSPYRSHMQGNLTVDESSGGSLVKEVATINGGNWSITNGLEAQHHGSDGVGGDRDAYSVAETTAGDKYDLSVDYNVTDTALYERAYKNGALVDAEIPFARQTDGSGNIIDGVILRALGCPITEAPTPRPGEGVIEGSISLQPQNGVEVEIREPV